MMTNDLLLEKYRVQKELDDKSGHGLTKCMANARLKMKEVEAVYGVNFKCAKPALASQKPAAHALELDSAS